MGAIVNQYWKASDGKCFALKRFNRLIYRNKFSRVRVWQDCDGSGENGAQLSSLRPGNVCRIRHAVSPHEHGQDARDA